MKSRSRTAAAKLRRSRFGLSGFEKPMFKRLASPELVVLRRQNSESMFTVSETLALLTALLLMFLLVYLFTGCAGSAPPRPGQAALTLMTRGKTNQAHLVQPENPKQMSRQKLTTQQSFEYVLPAGTELSLPVETAPPGTVARLPTPTPVTVTTSDSAESVIGGSYRDTSRAITAQVAQLKPVMWAGITMLTLVPAALVYFGWPTKAALSAAIGVGMIALASALPTHGTLILVGGLVVFGVAALLVLYSYHKGQLDQNHNGTPDLLERGGKTTG